MSRKEQLLTISNLNTAGKIRQMDDVQLNKYIEDLALFVKNFPAIEKKLKDSLDAEEYELFAKYLAVAGNWLARIYAEDMAAECREQLAWLKNATQEKIEVFVNYFLKSVSMLIIEIQKVFEEEQPLAVPSRANEPKEGKSILAVDDTEFFLHTLKTLLQDTPHKLTCTTSSKIALKKKKKNHPALFILDIDMPEMNGYELARKIRECGQQAPIIFLTGNNTQESVEKALMAGASDFIKKPINKEQLLQRINKFI
jgi:CheY-like chemotaxis protein